MLTFSRLNNLLVVLIILVNGYLIGAPLYPRVHLWWNQHVTHQDAKIQHVITSHKPSSSGKSSAPIPAGEHLLVPKLALNTEIFEGPNIATANKGVWHRPQSSSPAKGSNTVLAGHRFTYTNPTGIFYNLDKLARGDQIALQWDGVQYDYTVQSVAVVPPTDLSVEAVTTDKRLTIYTCTPLWSTKNRLVVTATRNAHDR